MQDTPNNTQLEKEAEKLRTTINSNFVKINQMFRESKWEIDYRIFSSQETSYIAKRVQTIAQIACVLMSSILASIPLFIFNNFRGSRSS
jgi:hypothetical protein